MLETVRFSLLKKYLDSSATSRGVVRGRHTWQTQDGEVISLVYAKEIDYEHVESILVDVLNKTNHDLDYFLGQAGIS